MYSILRNMFSHFCHDIVDPQVVTLGYHVGETSGKVVKKNSFDWS